MSQEIIELNVGGTVFRTTASTLWKHDGFFGAMLKSYHDYAFGGYEDDEDQSSYSASRCWSEGIKSTAGYDDCISPDANTTQSATKTKRIKNERRQIFLDRDPDVFPLILSYMRTGKVLIPPDGDDVLLERLLVEADFYTLTGLRDIIMNELEERSSNDDTAKTTPAGDEFKVIHNSELSFHFQQGWEYVDKFLGDETTACAVNGSKVKSVWRQNHCSACGEPMSFEKYSKHISYVQPTMIVLRRKANRHLLLGSSGSGWQQSNSAAATTTSVGWTIERPRFPASMNQDVDLINTPRPVPIPADLAFDESFG